MQAMLDHRTSVTCAARAPGRSLLSSAAATMRSAAVLLLTWRERARQRAALVVLSDHLLADIGVSRLDAEREAAKPFWAD